MTNDQINYITCVIGSLALITGKTCSYIYNQLNSVGIIKDYLAGAYDVLHTLSLEYVAGDILNIMKEKGSPLC